MNYFFHDYRDCVYVLHYMLKFHKANVTQLTLKKLLTRHPELPAPSSIIDVFSDFGINSVAIKKAAYTYEEFECPFICTMQYPDWERAKYIVITQLDSDNVKYLHPKTGNLASIDRREFEKLDSELIIFTDGEFSRSEEDYRKQRRQELLHNVFNDTFLFLSLILFVVFTTFKSFDSNLSNSWVGGALYILNFIGIIINGLILWAEVDNQNSFAKKVCGIKKQRVKCDLILKSKASTVFGLEWSKVGFSYFSSFFLLQTIQGPSGSGIISLHIPFSLIAFTYTLYSLYYQFIKIKVVCPLCLGIQIVLVLETVVSLLYLVNEEGFPAPDIHTYLVFFVTGLCLLSLSSVFLALWKNAKLNFGYRQNWNQLRLNKDVFKAMLNSAQSTVSSRDVGIVLGNVNAENEIIKVCNPYCGPCSQAHGHLEKIIRENANVKVRIIFAANAREDDKSSLFVSHLFSIRNSFGNQLVKEALDYWYNNDVKDVIAFSSRYPVISKTKEHQESLLAMREWCENMKIRATPTFFLNGRRLPDQYNIQDLKYLLSS